MLMQVFGQIGNRRSYLIMNRMTFGISGLAQGIKVQNQPLLLQRMQFLGYECFRKTRIALQDDGDGSIGIESVGPTGSRQGLKPISRDWNADAWRSCPPGVRTGD